MIQKKNNTMFMGQKKWAANTEQHYKDYIVYLLHTEQKKEQQGEWWNREWGDFVIFNKQG